MDRVIMERHSVRQYSSKPIEEDKRNILRALVKQCNLESGLNIQLIFNEPKCFDSMMAHYGKFTGVNNYIALVGPKSGKLDETTGYYGEMVVLKAQELGLNTCWVAMTHGKSAADIKNGEKQACLIALGYGENNGVQHKSKSIAEVCNCADNMPEWFKEGIAAALLAPTAVNQQKFYFTLLDDGTVSAKVKGIGFYTSMDLGIVKYHFQLASGHEVI